MKIRIFLLLLSLLNLIIFTILSYSVAKEQWTRIDFDTTVKLQDRIPRKFDKHFSSLSLVGSAEVTIGLCLLMIFLSILKFKWLRALGWLMILPASAAEVFGKLVLFHPAPPNFMHRTVLEVKLPFYVHTDFSYPSGHMTRTFFIITILIVLIYQSQSLIFKTFLICSLLGLTLLMGFTRVYLGEHWLSDVFGGSILGMGMGFFASILILPFKKD